MISSGLLGVLEVRRRDMWRRLWDTALRVVGDDDQQTEVAGRELSGSLSLEPLSASADSPARDVRLFRAPECWKLTRGISIQQLRRHGQGQEQQSSGRVP